jgi:long-chain fatty acid transport protein
MKKTIKLAVSAAMLLSATSALATNGDNMIGQGAASRAMGGVGIAVGFGADSALSNPALLSTVENMEVDIAATFFMPDVTVESNALSFNPTTGAFVGQQTSQKSAADFSVIPEVTFGHRVNDNFTYGVGIFGTAGMGVDVSKNQGLAQMQTNLALAKIVLPLAYNNGGLSLGVTPVLQYGTLSIEYATPAGPSNNGTSSDTGFGWEAGAAYEINGLTLGAVYKSEIAMEYKDQISKASTDFGMRQNPATGVVAGLTDELNQPAEFGVGVAYKTDGHTIALDYKNIMWGDSQGYQEFNWEDQRVIAIGYEYAKKDAWAVRVGYNHAENPIQEAAGANMFLGQYDGAAENFFNMAGFPGIVESHYSFGGGYSFSKALTVDMAVIYAAEVSQTVDTTAMSQGLAFQGALDAGADQATAGAAAGATGPSSSTTTHSQLGVTLGVTYKF